MGFSLTNAAKFAVSPVWGAWDYLKPQRPDSPTLPQSPTLTAPQLPQYPGFSPEQLQLLQQQQQYLQQSQQAQSGYQNNPYLQASQGADTQALENYRNALMGKIAPNQMIVQQKARDWAQTKEQAAQQGIRLSGDTPESAVSQSTAGNQIIQDFTKRYGALEQNYNLGQQQMGFQAQGQALGQQNQQFQNQMGGYQNLQGMNQNLFNPYQQQQMGQYGQQTQQALSNTDIGNQNLMNAYQQATGQQMTNYGNAMAGYNTNMGLLQSGIGAGAMVFSHGMAGGTPSQAPMQASNMGWGAPQSNNSLNYYNPGQSYIQQYRGTNG